VDKESRVTQVSLEFREPRDLKEALEALVLREALVIAKDDYLESLSSQLECPLNDIKKLN
jgi:hypothetical protein